MKDWYERFGCAVWLTGVLVLASCSAGVGYFVNKDLSKNSQIPELTAIALSVAVGVIVLVILEVIWTTIMVDRPSDP